MELYIITFKHGNYAVAAYSKLQSMYLTSIRLSSVPFSIKSECDLCIKTTDTESLKTILRECKGRFPIDNVYSAIRTNNSTVYKLLPFMLD